jgi:hypothetical protein
MVCAVVLAALGCGSDDASRATAGLTGDTAETGAIDPDADESGGDTDDPSDPDAPACDEPRVGAGVVRRMTRLEYDNTVRDLLGTDLRLAEGFVAEEELLGFDNNGAALTVGELLAEQYLAAAEQLAAEAVQDLSAIVPCDPAAIGDEACAREFAATFGQRAFRRPLEPAQIEILIATFDHGLAEGGFTAGIELMLEAILQSPSFLYRIEVGAEDPDAHGVAPLDAWEVASRLSYLLWNSMPDEALFAAAAAGELDTPVRIRAHAERMLDDPRAESAVIDFHRQLFDLDALDGQAKDPVAFPEFTPEVAASMRAEAERFAADVVLQGDGSWATLLFGGHTFLDAKLAQYYGIAMQLGEELERVELPPEAHRGGLLRSGALHAALGKYATTAPVLRGEFVRTQLLCQTLPPPPDNVEFEPPDVDPDATARERYSEHTANAECAACHALMDPIGFGFEHYDGAGGWRAVENGFPIDASGELVGTRDIDGPFDGVEGLASKLAQSEEARACVVTQWFRYAHGREEADDDACTFQWLEERFEGGDVRELILALTQTDAFRFVKVVEGP